MKKPLTAEQLLARLQKAIDFGGGEISIEELVEETRAGRMQCWWSDQACVFTKVVLRGTGKVLNIYLAAGELDACLALLPRMIRFGSDEGCKVVLVHGREGWTKPLEQLGWKRKYITWELAL